MTDLKPTINVGHGTGTPAGMPDFRPLNPWGRAMPKPMRQPRPSLWQIFVKDARTGTRIAVGPKAPKEFSEALIERLNLNIVVGIEKQWSDPELVCVAGAGNEKPSQGSRIAL